MTKKQLQWAMYEAYVAQLLNRIEAQEAEVAKLGTMAEHARADAVTRAAADGKRIDGLLTQVQALSVALRTEQEAHDGLKQALGIQAAKEAGKVLGMANGEGLRSAAKRVIKERDDMRAALAKEQELHTATALRLSTEAAKLAERKPGAWIKTNDGRVLSVRGYLVRLSPDREELYDGGVCTPCEPPDQAERKHPVKVGEYVKRMTGFNTTPAGEIGRVTLIDDDNADDIEYWVKRPNGERGVWSARNCTPCDPPTAAHDTPEGRSVAESVIRNDRKTEPADDVKEGDVVEVVSATHRLYTEHEDLGCRGVVTVIDGMRLLLGEVPGYKLPIRGIVGKCDVRKVTT